MLVETSFFVLGHWNINFVSGTSTDHRRRRAELTHSGQADQSGWPLSAACSRRHHWDRCSRHHPDFVSRRFAVNAWAPHKAVRGRRRMIARGSIECTGAQRLLNFGPMFSKTPHYLSHIPTSTPPNFGGWAEGRVASTLRARSLVMRSKRRSYFASVTAPQR
jgi:hypothetical protein